MNAEQEAQFLVIQVTHPDQLRRMVPDLTRLFGDFLHRAQEPFDVRAQWAALLRNLAHEHHLFLVALDARIRPVGFLIAQDGYDWWGIHYANVVQTYAKPGTDVTSALNTKLEEWATSRKAQVVSAITLRHPGAFARLVKRFGWHPFGTMFVRLREDDNGKGQEPAPDAAGG